MSKILVIGGSYFTGRVFVMVASAAGDELTLINRGRYSMSHYQNVKEFRCDRHDAGALAALPLDEEYDAVVDFCAYTPDDAKTLFESLPCRFRQYIVLTTADVYVRTGGVRDEDTPLLTKQDTADQVDDYIYNKRMLEDAVRECAAAKDVRFTILRPAFIYGPYNYAPRENFYFKKIYQNEPLPLPANGGGQFQMVYVKDVANAVRLCFGNEKAYDEAFNLAAPDVLDYPKFFGVLARITDREFQIQSVEVQQVIDQHIAVPFPLFPEESELFDGSKAQRVLGLEYTDLDENMGRTFRGLKNVYAPEG